MPVGTEPVVVPFKSLDVDGLTIGLSCIAARMTSASGRTVPHGQPRLRAAYRLA